jgi:hypothetical protein
MVLLVSELTLCSIYARMAMSIQRSGDMTMAMKRTQIYLSEEQRRKIKRLAELQHKSMAQVIREAVEDYMIRQASNENPPDPTSPSQG